MRQNETIVSDETNEMDRSRILIFKKINVWFNRRPSRVPNLMQMSENNDRFFSFALDSEHVKFDV